MKCTFCRINIKGSHYTVFGDPVCDPCFKELLRHDLHKKMYQNIDIYTELYRLIFA